MPKHKSGADEAVRVKAYTILGQALYDCHCHVECYEFWLELTQRTEVPGLLDLRWRRRVRSGSCLCRRRRLLRRMVARGSSREIG